MNRNLELQDYLIWAVAMKKKTTQFVHRLATLNPEESPNDFDKNHQVKVDTHLVV